LSFRGGELDITTKERLRLGNHQFRGDGLNITDYRLSNSGCLLFRGDKLDIIINEKAKLGNLSVQR